MQRSKKTRPLRRWRRKPPSWRVAHDGAQINQDITSDSTHFFECGQGETQEFVKDDGDNNDPRFTLTPWEHESTIRLQQACHEKQIHYESLLELVKYVLLVRSCCKDNDPKADQKRLRLALERLQKRRSFEAKYRLNEIDSNEALDVAAKAVPEYFVSDYTTDKDGGGRRVVVAHGPTEKKWILESKQHLAYYFKHELYRCDLAAADLEEARQGITMLVRWGEGRFRVNSCLAYLRAAVRGQEMMYPMHNHRIKRIYVQTSPLAQTYANMMMKMLPLKLKQRVVVVSTLKELHGLVDCIPEGTQKTVQEWTAEREQVYNRTVQQLKL